MKQTIIAPSILAADVMNLGGSVAEINASGAQWVHIDIMDGHFVPNLSFGPQLVAALRPITSAFLDVHLMIEEPENFIEAFARSGADGITFHLEAAVHSHRLLGAIRGMGKKAGLSIVPSTPASLLEELLPFVDMVLVMTVNPGFGGQVLISECLEKVRKIAAMREGRGLDFLISVDGGISERTAPAALQAGADVLVAGSAFFAAADKLLFIRGLKKGGLSSNHMFVGNVL